MAAVITGLAATATGAAPGTGTTPGTGTAPGTGTGTAGTAKPPVSTAFRASIKSVKLAKNRRSARVVVACPASAPGCLVAVTGKVRGRAAFKSRSMAVTTGASRSFKVKLKRAAAKRLRTKGGKLKVTAVTGFSSLAPSSKTAKASKPRRRKRR